jgi:hypothetical protein
VFVFVWTGVLGGLGTGCYGNSYDVYEMREFNCSSASMILVPS